MLENFKHYRVTVIALDRSTSKEAVCVVFEKVNTGGKALDAFELVTAMYAASGHELRKGWYGDEKTKGRHRRLVDTLRLADTEKGILAGVSNTDFLQAVSLFYTRDRRQAAVKAGKELPAVSGNRQALLDLPLEAYIRYETQVEAGFVRAAKFLHMLHIYRIFDLPYQSTAPDARRLAIGLRHLLEETAYAPWAGNDEETARLTLIRVDAVRLSVMLAQQGHASDATEQWIAAAASDELPEVRFAAA